MVLFPKAPPGRHHATLLQCNMTYMQCSICSVKDRDRALGPAYAFLRGKVRENAGRIPKG